MDVKKRVWEKEARRLHSSAFWYSYELRLLWHTSYTELWSPCSRQSLPLVTLRKGAVLGSRGNKWHILFQQSIYFYIFLFFFFSIFSGGYNISLLYILGILRSLRITRKFSKSSASLGIRSWKYTAPLRGEKQKVSSPRHTRPFLHHRSITWTSTWPAFTFDSHILFGRSPCDSHHVFSKWFLPSGLAIKSCYSDGLFGQRGW
jgi:hypothetical protein